ncbi:tRNA(Met) cytidine acetyltransferase TmcA [Psychromonas hadalis]|uniref:tRNA(Met) cytidine acetyltransferase TmcA n=1 Tax=Psychromonas hadalis TaxID=211669 RepID=UPI000411A6CA|nr:GNAT family N-acetyltransferase [Psychromonas hadalis]
MPYLHTTIETAQQIALQANHRQLIQLIGNATWVMQQAKKIIKAQHYFWVGEAPQGVINHQYKQLLGLECELLIINAHDHFDANAFAGAEGTLKGGGLLILLSDVNNESKTLFDSYLQQQLNNSSFLQFTENEPLPTLATPLPYTQQPLNLQQQQHAIEAIIKTVTGHRRRPLVLTANRGRGKSAALGIAAKQLVKSGIQKILICAPNKGATTTLFKHAGESEKITFIAPDLLLQTRPPCDLLLIDEAAALPVPMLEALTLHYSRLVFATTLHGYEGSGRGFALRFQKRLKEIAPQYRFLHLDQPIRWDKKDPLEQFTLQHLCLTESKTKAPDYDCNKTVQFELIKAEQLLENHALLTELFSLLVTAHYQTKPSDLEKLLNDPQLSILLLTQNQQILSVALINHEGEIEQHLARQILQGERRIQGHLVAQSLTFHCTKIDAAAHKYARIQRIATHPTVQRQGLGKLFIEKITAWAKTQQFDHLCASFGATDELLKFWQNRQFSTLRIGSRKDTSSGTHSFIVNKPISEKAKKLHISIQKQFQQQLTTQVSRHLQQLETGLIISLLSEFKKHSISHPLINNYAQGNLPYEFAEFQLITLISNSDISLLDKKQQTLTIQKILQNRSWAEICQEGQYTGKKQAQLALRNAINQLIPKELKR